MPLRETCAADEQQIYAALRPHIGQWHTDASASMGEAAHGGDVYRLVLSLIRAAIKKIGTSPTRPASVSACADRVRIEVNDILLGEQPEEIRARLAAMMMAHNDDREAKD